MTVNHVPADGSTGHMVVAAGRDDLEVLSQVIADAFHPLAVSQWLIPDPVARRKVFPAYFRIFAEHAMDTGTVFTTPARTGVALWLPVGMEGPQQPENYETRLAVATGPWRGKFTQLDAAFERHHPTGMTHHHLAILAVHPGLQCTGIGTALLDPFHRILDAGGLPAYLEASGLDTRKIYLRHGYTDLAPPIRLPAGPMMYPMLRHPGPDKMRR